MAEPSSSQWVPASAEDVELFLEPELFLDVRVDNKIQNNNTNNNSNSNSNSNATHREWLEAETVEVKGRNILVRFLTVNRPDEWINVDEEIDRLAELHSMTEQESQGDLTKKKTGLNPNIQFETDINVDELFDDCIKKCFSGLSESNNNESSSFNLNRTNSVGVTIKADELSVDFLQRWFNVHSLAKSHSSSSISSNNLKRKISESESKSNSNFNNKTDDDMQLLNDSMEVEQVFIQVPLYDPLTHCRLINPVRGRDCVHSACFDLRTHIEYNKNTIIWQCPICKKEAFAEDLEVDQFILYILQTITNNPSTCSSSGSLDKRSNSSLFQPKIERSFSELSETRNLIVYRDGSWSISESGSKNRANSKRLKRATSSQTTAIYSQSSYLDPFKTNLTNNINNLTLQSQNTYTISNNSIPSLNRVLTRAPTIILQDGIEYIDLTDDDHLDPDYEKWMNFTKVKVEIIEAAEKAKLEKEKAAEKQRIIEMELKSLQENPAVHAAIAAVPMNLSFVQNNNNMQNSQHTQNMQRIHAMMITGAVNSLNYNNSSVSNNHNHNRPIPYVNPFFPQPKAKSKSPRKKSSKSSNMPAAAAAADNRNNKISIAAVVPTNNSSNTNNTINRATTVVQHNISSISNLSNNNNQNSNKPNNIHNNIMNNNPNNSRNMNMNSPNEVNINNYRMPTLPRLSSSPVHTTVSSVNNNYNNSGTNNMNSNRPALIAGSNNYINSNSNSSSNNLHNNNINPMMNPVHRVIVPTINLNTCSVYELLGADIDYEVAAKIIAHRERKVKGRPRIFHSIEEIKKIKGVGEKNFRKLAPFVLV